MENGEDVPLHRPSNNASKPSSRYTAASLVTALAALAVAFISLLSVIILASASSKPGACATAPLTCNDQAGSPLFDETPTSVLVVGAHPDDIEVGGSGTLIKWSKKGVEINYILITNGEKGSDDISQTAEEISRIRQAEQLCAANVVGVKNVHFLNVSDGTVASPTAKDYIQEQLAYYIRLYKPDIVMTWDPARHHALYNAGLEHEDHQTTGSLVLSVVYPIARNNQFFKNQLLPPPQGLGLTTHKVNLVYLFNWFWDTSAAPGVNVAVDLTDEEIETKSKALYCHKSQVTSKDDATKLIKNIATALGSARGYKYAEYFTRVKMLA